MKFSTAVGTKVTRKRDGRPGFIAERFLSVPSVAHPGVWGKTVVTVHFTEEDGIGGPNYSTGDLGWLRSNFKPVRGERMKSSVTVQFSSGLKGTVKEKIFATGTAYAKWLEKNDGNVTILRYEVT